jgi:hypothetical protein
MTTARSATLTEDEYGIFGSKDEGESVIYVDEFRHLEMMVKEHSTKLVEQGNAYVQVTVRR